MLNVSNAFRNNTIIVSSTAVYNGRRKWEIKVGDCIVTMVERGGSAMTHTPSGTK